MASVGGSAGALVGEVALASIHSDSEKDETAAVEEEKEPDEIEEEESMCPVNDPAFSGSKRRPPPPARPEPRCDSRALARSLTSGV